ncbi:hypothetical protein AWRI1631_111760 [Saccharomyces cerevisiae AWRI1631]|uniref:Uncharacterized protein n=1 Tax=Saccharomyces cerevisiae (strain AWRI1631) TaxID=545124 RepID=B5VMA7_YEAS6|nr:hypothetical protein AWRI1631_111760 [Saccharomyces cerevisiae AWRI1631]
MITSREKLELFFDSSVPLLDLLAVSFSSSSFFSHSRSIMFLIIIISSTCNSFNIHSSVAISASSFAISAEITKGSFTVASRRSFLVGIFCFCTAGIAPPASAVSPKPWIAVLCSAMEATSLSISTCILLRSSKSSSYPLSEFPKLSKCDLTA